ncbi:MAG: hypothetical protein ABF311_02585 [Polaribacter sp.]
MKNISFVLNVNTSDHLSVGCAAFPEDIPSGMGVLFQHNKPLPGQKNDIIFEEGDPDESF